MKRLENILLVLLWIFAGCAATQQMNAPAAQPELIRISSLPSLTPLLFKQRLTLNILFRVLRDGSIEEVRLLRGSGEPAWDAVALDSIREWRFTPIVGDYPPNGMWMRNTIVVQEEEPLVINLGELPASGLEEADSLYALLESGVPFESLVKDTQRTTGALGSILGPTDIARFPRKVRDELRRLGAYGFTRPIRVGENYVIYKRFDHETAQ